MENYDFSKFGLDSRHGESSEVPFYVVAFSNLSFKVPVYSLCEFVNICLLSGYTPSIHLKLRNNNKEF